MSGEDTGRDPEGAVRRAEQLLERLERAREEVDRLADTEDVEAVIELLNEIAEIGREAEVELTRAKREADAGS